MNELSIGYVRSVSAIDLIGEAISRMTFVKTLIFFYSRLNDR